MISKNELKFIRSLKNKKYRVSEKCFLVEGSKNVLELLDSNFKIRWVVGTKEFRNVNDRNLEGADFKEIPKSDLSAISTLKTNDSALAVVQCKEFVLEDIDLSGVIYGLDGISDPGNLGTIIRTLDWFGVDQIVCSKDSVEFYNPKVIAATMGSFTRVKIVYTDLVPFLKSSEVSTVGADLTGMDLVQWQPSKPLIVVMGSESHGISQEVKKCLGSLISIKGTGKAESLNVGVATGIIR